MTRAAASRPHVLVVGGGPVGLATAIATRLRGLAVTVLEAREPPIDKACGEGVLPAGVECLRRLGVRLDGAGRALAGIAWRDERSAAFGRFPRTAGLGVRRTVLHRRLQDRAAELGAELRFGVRALELVRTPHGFALRSTDGLHEPRFLVAADGLGSPLRRAADLDGRPSRRRRLGVRRHLARPPREEQAAGGVACVEVRWTHGAEAYVTPVSEDESGIALLWEDGAPASVGTGRGSRFDRLIRTFPELSREVERGGSRSRDRGAGPLRRRARAVVSENLVLAGDAAGYVDAITGEGLSLGFLEAEALADSLANEDLRGYAAAVRALRRVPEALTELCLLLSRHPRLRRRTLAAFAREPRLFEALLAVHVGAARPEAPLAARLLWRVAIAR